MQRLPVIPSYETSGDVVGVNRCPATGCSILTLVGSKVIGFFSSAWTVGWTCWQATNGMASKGRKTARFMAKIIGRITIELDSNLIFVPPLVFDLLTT